MGDEFSINQEAVLDTPQTSGCSHPFTIIFCIIGGIHKNVFSSLDYNGRTGRGRLQPKLHREENGTSKVESMAVVSSFLLPKIVRELTVRTYAGRDHPSSYSVIGRNL
jgi:hypothetical protein